MPLSLNTHGSTFALSFTLLYILVPGYIDELICSLKFQGESELYLILGFKITLNPCISMETTTWGLERMEHHSDYLYLLIKNFV